MPINKQKNDVNKMLFHQEFHSSSKTKQKNTRKIHHYFFFCENGKLNGVIYLTLKSLCCRKYAIKSRKRFMLVGVRKRTDRDENVQDTISTLRSLSLFIVVVVVFDVVSL